MLTAHIMIAYWSLKALPEWAALTGAQRRRVWKNAIHPLMIGWPVMLVKVWGTLLLLLGVFSPGMFRGEGIISGFISICLLGEVVDFVVVARHKGEITKFIRAGNAADAGMTI